MPEYRVVLSATLYVEAEEEDDAEDAAIQAASDDPGMFEAISIDELGHGSD